MSMMPAGTVVGDYVLTGYTQRGTLPVWRNTKTGETAYGVVQAPTQQEANAAVQDDFIYTRGGERHALGEWESSMGYTPGSYDNIPINQFRTSFPYVNLGSDNYSSATQEMISKLFAMPDEELLKALGVTTAYKHPEFGWIASADQLGDMRGAIEGAIAQANAGTSMGDILSTGFFSLMGGLGGAAMAASLGLTGTAAGALQGTVSGLLAGGASTGELEGALQSALMGGATGALSGAGSDLFGGGGVDLTSADMAHLPEWGASLTGDDALAFTQAMDEQFGSFADLGFDPDMSKMLFGTDNVYDALYGMNLGTGSLANKGIMNMTGDELDEFAKSTFDVYGNTITQEQLRLLDPSTKIDQYTTEGGMTWDEVLSHFDFSKLSPGTVGESGYVPEIGDDSGGLTQTDAIFRSNKQRKGVPGSGFTTFQIGSPGLFIP